MSETLLIVLTGTVQYVAGAYFGWLQWGGGREATIRALRDLRGRGRGE